MIIGFPGGGFIGAFGDPLFIGETHGGNSISVVLNKPTGVIDADEMYAFVSTSGASPPTITEPAGWSLVGSYTTNAPYIYIYKKTAASEGASYTWGFGTALNTIAICAWRNVKPTANLVGVFTHVTTATGSIASSITPTEPGVLIQFSAALLGSADSYTPASGMTELVDFSSSTIISRTLIEIAELNPQPATATGDKSSVHTTSAASTSVLMQLARR